VVVDEEAAVEVPLAILALHDVGVGVTAEARVPFEQLRSMVAAEQVGGREAGDARPRREGELREGVPLRLGSRNRESAPNRCCCLL
jgi:hypothetical protein